MMFTIRGMAYGLTDVPEDLERKLREYEIKNISLPRRDLRVCQNILNVSQVLIGLMIPRVLRLMGRKLI